MQSNQINFYQNDKLNIKITSVNVFFVDFSNQPVFRHQTKIKSSDYISKHFHIST